MKAERNNILVSNVGKALFLPSFKYSFRITDGISLLWLYPTVWYGADLWNFITLTLILQYVTMRLIGDVACRQMVRCMLVHQGSITSVTDQATAMSHQDTWDPSQYHYLIFRMIYQGIDMQIMKYSFLNWKNKTVFLKHTGHTTALYLGLHIFCNTM